MVAVAGSYFDGQSAQSHEVEILEGVSGLEIRDRQGLRIASWPYEALVAVDPPETGRPLRLACGSEDPARLMVPEWRRLSNLLHHAPQLQPRRHRQTSLLRAGVLGLVGVALIVGLLFYALPWTAGHVARVIPIAWEEALGEKALGDLEGVLGLALDKPVYYCEGPRGQAALEDLVGRLSAEETSGYGYRVKVLDLDVVNAFALPGGHIVVFRGLIEQADTPEEVAGILAHEMAHVTERHGTQALLRNLSQSLLFELIYDDPSGGTLGGLSGVLTHLSYSREAEQEADRLAINRLRSANISSQGLVDFFHRLAEQQGELTGPLALLSTHPSHGSREALFQGSATGGGPAMGETDWRALQGICKEAS